MGTFKNLSKISSFLSNFSAQFEYTLYHQPSRPMAIFGKKKSKKVKSKCPDITCHEKPKKKQSLFTRLFRKKPKVQRPRPPIECCRIKQAEYKCKPEPDLSGFGGKAFKTCGEAFVVQKTHTAPEVDPVKTEPEAKILRVIEGEVGTTKENFKEKMPKFTTVEQRLLDLHDRRLHPMYKNFENIPQDKALALPQRPMYKTRSGPIRVDDLPKKLAFNRALLESKNRFADYKRVEPPYQLVGRILEMQMNEKPTLRKKRMPILPEDAKRSDKRSVFDTLYQKELKF